MVRPRRKGPELTRSITIRLSDQDYAKLEAICGDLVVGPPWVVNRGLRHYLDALAAGGDVAEALSMETRRRLDNGTQP